MLATSAPSVTQLQLPFSYQRHSKGEFEAEGDNRDSGEDNIESSVSSDKTTTKISIITNSSATPLTDIDHPSSDDIDDPFLSHNSLSARSMSSLATTVDSSDYEKTLATNIAINQIERNRQMSGSSTGSINGLDGSILPVRDYDNVNDNLEEVEDRSEIDEEDGQKIGNDTFYDAPNSNTTTSSLAADSLLTVTDGKSSSEKVHDTETFSSYKGLKISTKGTSSPLLSFSPDDVISPMGMTNGSNHINIDSNNVTKTIPTGSKSQQSPSSIHSSQFPHYLHSPSQLSPSASAKSVTPQLNGMNPADNNSNQFYNYHQPSSPHANNLRASSAASVASANVLPNGITTASGSSPLPGAAPNFRGSLPALHSYPHDSIPPHIRESIDSIPPSTNFRSSIGSTFSFDDQRFLPRGSTGSYNSISSPISPVSPQQLALLRSPNPSASSSSSLPSLARAKTSTATTANPMSPPSQPQPPVRATSQQIIPTSANNRNSLSSQRSAASSQEVPSVRRLSFYAHRNSFSFSRRRSTVTGPPIPHPPPHEDRSASAVEIERLREEIIVQRENRRRRKEFLEDERVLIGTKVSEGHVNYVTAYNMLTGIRVSVSRCNGKVDRQLTDEDFTASNKLAFDVSGNELTPSARYDFKFKDYSPWVFRHLRQLFKLDPADYLMSLTSKYIVSELGSPGKSGSFFYFSRDYRFIIKTIHHSEHKMLRKILKDYYNHVKNNPNTLISQFYGLHRVKLPFGRKIHFIVMNNLFPPHRDIHRTFDLKGSTLGRRLIEVPQDQSNPGRKKTVVYKDLNWIDHGESISLGPTKKKQFLDQLEIDVALLKRLNIMDYSLLIGIHDLTKGNTENIRDSTLQVFEPGSAIISKSRVAELRKALVTAGPTALAELDLVLNQYERNDFTFYADSGGFRATDENNEPLSDIYYLGIIDCLTPYTFTKRVETFFKGLSNVHITISAVPATEYGDRFYSFIKSVVSTKKSPQGHARIENAIEGVSPVSASQHTAGPPDTLTVNEISAIESHLPVLSEASTEARSEN